MNNQLLASRYQIVQQLGKGSFGETYLAMDIHLPKHPYCVVKKLKPQQNTSFVMELSKQYFYKEAEVLMNLGEHPQIPRLFAYFTEDDNFYLVMEFIDGNDLDKEMGQQWASMDVYCFLSDMLNILNFLHKKSVVHRDIKPSNILRRKQDDKLVLVDFGCIKEVSCGAILDSQYVDSSIIIGTPIYMPPEQALGKPRPNSDIYSVGMIAIEMITGYRLQTLHNANYLEDAKWKSLALNFDQELLNIVERMVCPSYKERYATPDQIIADLHAISKFNCLLIPFHDIHPFRLSFLKKYNQLLSKSYASLGNFSITPTKIININNSADLAMDSALIKNYTLDCISRNRNLSPEQSVQLSRSAPADPSDTQSLLPCLPLNDVAPMPDTKVAYPENKSASVSTKHSLSKAKLIILGMTTGFSLMVTVALVAKHFQLNHRKTPMELAIQSYKRAEYKNSINILNELLIKEPDHVPALLQRGMAYYNLKSTNTALDDFHKVIELDSSQYQVIANFFKTMGDSSVEMENFKDAITHYNYAIHFDPKNAEIYIALGRAQYSLGHYQAAYSSFYRATTLDPSQEMNTTLPAPFPPSDYFLQGAYGSAIDAANELIIAYPQDVRAYFWRAKSYAKIGEFQAALQDFNHIIALKHEHSIVYSNRGHLRIQMGDVAGGIRDLDHAIKLNKNLPDAYFWRGTAKADLGHKEEGIQDVLQARTLYQLYGDMEAVKQVDSWLIQSLK